MSDALTTELALGDLGHYLVSYLTRVLHTSSIDNVEMSWVEIERGKEKNGNFKLSIVVPLVPILVTCRVKLDSGS